MGRIALGRASWIAAALGLGIGIAGGCVLELEHQLACGDGYVDVLAGEQCDPRAGDSPHLTYCLDKNLGGGKDGKGQALCNAQCQIEADAEICAFCGDGIAAGPNEECDGSDLRGAICASGDGQLGCKAASEPEGVRCTFDASGCNPCGDGVDLPDDDEECDFSTRCTSDEECPPGKVCDLDNQYCLSPDDLAAGVECSLLEGPKGNYAKGVVTNADCTTDCFYERRRCNYCGDGELDPEYPDYTALGNFVQKAEVCDGDAFDQEALVGYCQELCTGGPNMTTLQLRCEFACNDSCSGFIDQPWEDPVKESAHCCVLGGEPCDGPGGFPCCYALDHPKDAENACLTDTLPKPLCRSG